MSALSGSSLQESKCEDFSFTAGRQFGRGPSQTPPLSNLGTTPRGAGVFLAWLGRTVEDTISVAKSIAALVASVTEHQVPRLKATVGPAAELHSKGLDLDEIGPAMENPGPCER